MFSSFVLCSTLNTRYTAQYRIIKTKMNYKMNLNFKYWAHANYLLLIDKVMNNNEVWGSKRFWKCVFFFLSVSFKNDFWIIFSSSPVFVS